MTLLFIGMAVAVGIVIALVGASIAKFGADVPRFGDE